MISLFTDNIVADTKKFGTDYVYHLYVFTDKSKRYSRFISYFVNIKTGEEIFFRTLRESGLFSESFIDSYIEKDLIRISK
ncbi:MAG: hypothetical protein JKY54_11355 [Flavobacteriales bacterium]|nr:hypothetical protein [Flavobacteriales bacterium]